MTTYKVYSGYNSPFIITITDIKGAPYSAAAMATITRTKIKYVPSSGADAEPADSVVAGHENVFDKETYAATGEMVVDMGPLLLTAGRDNTAEVVVYDTAYPSGRVVCQIDLWISDEIGTGDIPAATTVLDVEGDTVLTTANLGQAICAVSTNTIALTAPSVGSAQNGKWIDIIQGGTGNITFACADSDTVGDSTSTVLTLSGTSTYTHVRVQYFHAITAWVVFRMGSISAS